MSRLLSFFFFCQCFICAAFSQIQQKPFPYSVSANANRVPEACGTDVILHNAREDARFKAAEDKMNADILNYNQRVDSTATIITLPVVFHIVNQNPGAITDVQIINALNDLNDAFGKTGLYSSSAGADTKIRFCLAKKDPEGGITNGITRTTSFFSSNLNPVIEDTRLKNLVDWDPSRYINIWYVTGVELEIVPLFQCGKWIRMRAGGYATMPPGGGFTDGIVVTGFGSLLAHEMGHYLGLYHTFEGLNCANFDCTTNGDKVCDTPPDASVGNSASCTSPYNSCLTDTLSGFTVDMPDQIANFMDYGNAGCHNEFTDGQAQRMRAAINTQRAGLLQDECTPPCSDNILATFTRNNAYPLSGDVITFTNTSTGASTYEWLVDGTVLATTTDFTNSFASAGKYRVTLKAYNGNACFSSYSEDVIVTCGVTARFYTDKQKIASKAGIYLDSIQFTNTSENATSYQWIMSSTTGMAEQVISTSKDLNYVFQTPGNYSVKLIATSGACSDTTNIFPVPVADPAADGALGIQKAECYQQTKVRVAFYVCNYGYASIPRNIPVSFYDDDPRLATANKVGSTFFIPDSITGNCCGFIYTHIVDVGSGALNKIYAVFNDSGTTRPLNLPNTNLPESNYNNNIAALTNFAFKITIAPPSAILEWHDTLQLKAAPRAGTVSSYVWSPAKNLSCINCSSPFLLADSTTIKRVIATSNLGCMDTAYVDIQVPPYNDYAVTINDAQCTGRDSLYVNFTLNNYFKRGVLPETLTVSFYSGDPSTGSAVLLKPQYTLPDTILAKQFTFSTFIKAISAGNLYAVVNDSAVSLPVSFPNTLLLEKSYLNNISNILYKPEAIVIQPADTTVFRTLPLALNLKTTIYNPASTLWSAGSTYTLSCSTCTNPIITPYKSSVVQAQTENKYGCLLTGTTNIKVFPPDMQVQILDTKCYLNNSALVTFSICMNNLYDSILAGIPVSFYDGDPATGKGRLLQPIFYTPKMQAGQCYTYTTRVTAPTTNQLFAVVNDKGDSSGVPKKQYDETNYNNNIAQAVYTPFKINIVPADTSIPRLTSVTLASYAQGGTVSAYLWSPMQFLSCTSCASAIVKPQYTMQYQLFARNEFACTDTALATVRTLTSDGVFIPDAFTPNRDNLNDIFYILGGPDVSMIKDFLIYNRWGQKVFSMQNVLPNNPAFGWNGKISADDAPTGAYVYYVVATLANGTQKEYKGTIMLIR